MSFIEKNKTHIHWFRDDLRVLDQPFEFLGDYSFFFGVYILQPYHIKYTKHGFRKMGLNRLYHLRESLFELQKSLREKNSDLLICYGEPDKIFKGLCIKHNASLSYQKAYGTEEKDDEQRVIAALKNQLIFSWEGNFLIQPDEFLVDEGNFPKSFSGFRKKAEKITKNSTFNSQNTIEKFPLAPKQFSTIKAPKLITHKLSAIPFSGGCLSGVKRLETYLFHSKSAAHYKETRNGLIGQDYSSKLSLYLANGALSPNQVMEQIKEFEKRIVKNQSTYWLYFELLWRDYFRHALRHYNKKMFLKQGLNKEDQVINNTDDAFKSWSEGNTAASFVNANMNELRGTGFMSNRGRQNVASYLVHDLKVDWRKGAAWFEHCLKDYDVASNQGNWMYISGNGFNPKGKSYFDIDFQVKMYDPKHEYTILWTK